MHSNCYFPCKKAEHCLGNQMDSNYMYASDAYTYGAVLPPCAKNLPPFHGVELQPSEVCPKNFIIFDQTDYRSQIIFNPAFAPKFNGLGLNIHPNHMDDKFEINGATNEEREVTSTFKENSDDIDALLSLDYEEDQSKDSDDVVDDDVVSTARSGTKHRGNSSDTCSSYRSKHRKNGLSSSQKSIDSESSSCSDDKKQRKMKKMVKALRGIIPSGNQMSTAMVLDEAVKYLKSLKVEVQKLGDFEN